ncbi:hypothetical protein [Kribbella sp. NPDC048915]|uniref:hypothetical protein n=1 Tax=Kribbella sp. NPDC048915 TaxID=3155148 RepID=UPI0033DB62E1
MPRWLEAWGGLQTGFALFIGGLVVVGWLTARIGGPWVDRGKAKLSRDQAGAERYGWHSSTDADGQLQAAGTSIFSSDGHVRGVLAGEYGGRPVRMAEFVYITRGKYLRTTWVNHLIAIELPVRLPGLVVMADGVTRNLGALAADLVMEPVEGESEAFNRRFRAVGADARYGSAVLHPRMMQWLLDHPVNLRISGNLVLVYDDEPWTVARTLAALPVLSGVVDLIPPFVLADYGQPVR